MMVNSSTDINKTNNHLPSKLVNTNKDLYDVDNPGPCFGTGTKMWWD